MSFARTERARQKLLCAAAYSPGELLPSGIQLADLLTNITPDAREGARWYFGEARRIVWHRHANHALSSQAACVNFLMPLATRPDLLGKVIERALGHPVKMLPVEEGAQGQPWHVAFEWTGREDYLDEWGNGVAVRGQNATSADAMMQFDAGNGRETLLIEWKYTERYGRPSPAWVAGNPTRIKRYKDKAFDPAGPIRADLGLTVDDFLFEPIYQLFRQQMLAWRMQEKREDGATRVRVLHISPKGNIALHKVTAPSFASRGEDVFHAFREVLVDPDAFIPRSAEDLFGPLLEEEEQDQATRAWLDDLGHRYSFLRDPSETASI